MQRESVDERARSGGREAVAVGRGVVALVREREVTFLAAGIAYYAFVSLLPALLLLLVVASTLGGPELAAEVVAATGNALSPVGQDLVRSTLVDAAGATPATLVGVVLLAWSTLKVFRGLDIAFSRIYGTEAAESMVGKVRDAAVALGAVGVGLAALVGVGVAVSYAGVALAGLLGTVALAVVLSVVFFPLFVIFPDTEAGLAEAVPGTVFAAVGWTLLGTGFRLYAGMAGQFDVYGVLGVVLLLVTWYYAGATVLLVGAALNAVLADRRTTNTKGEPGDGGGTRP
ncbi:YihY/virulence factor BrkB family protein [Halosimplex pelagicum]|uniref:YihY/virulence factor BrkB family protein n=1 Tax=Halosimplex pelagicum TaxID=869886 RepID=A0A7D5T9G1_9EURY|nr:YihY/virulence factor BrkB family protein [Halosimplex pelagicum]QLH80533.1 YihY/virulence factor BrkB family protein [Halosimplex pelagicum]